MPPPLLLSPEAHADLLEAFEWYEGQRSGLGSEFLAEVARVLQRIEDGPLGYAVVQEDTRRAVVRRFPYSVFWTRATPRLTDGLADPRQRGLSPVPTCSHLEEESRDRESRYKAALQAGAEITLTALSWLLPLTHFCGLALGAGAATAKLLLLIKSKADHTFIPVYIKVAKPLTRQIAVGLILLTLSGITWLLLGYAVTRLLIVKIILVAAIWMLGPVIDKVIEPKFHKLTPGPGEAASLAFRRSQTQYLTLEVITTLLFYVIIVMWVAR